MLEPRDRSLLFDSLRPPLGYRLDCAVGTTFSLDLMTLLTVPLAFVLFDSTDEDGRPQADPLALLESLRRSADRMVIFCQTGRIAVPPKQLLLSNLEECVIQVQAPRKGGVFHPKIWAIRFTPTEAESADPTVYRLICASRNITFDRSWDTVLVLDGEVSNHPRSLKVNRPLANFIASLPDLASASTGKPALKRARQLTVDMAAEIQRVEFEVPEEFEDFRFWPLGIDDQENWPFGDWLDRLAIVSPFVSDRMLKTLADQAGKAALVSRVDSLESVKPSVIKEENFAEVFYMDTTADAEDIHEGAEDNENEEEGADNDGAVVPSPEHETLTGLHAKIYVADIGRSGHVWTGSANATNAAFHQNVEFLVELIGKKRNCGVDSFLGTEDDATKFRRLLIPFSPREKPKVDAIQKQLEQAVEDVRRLIAEQSFIAEVAPFETSEEFSLALKLEGVSRLRFPTGIRLRCWPITLLEGRDGVDLSTAFKPTVFEPISFQALTSFFAFRVSAEAEGKSCEQAFVLNVPLIGAPENRHDRLLLSILHDRNQVFRLLLLLLADDGTDVPGVLGAITKTEGGATDDRHTRVGSLPLLEPLIRALAKDPHKLDRVHRLIEDLRKTEEGREMLPDRLDEVWQPIWQVRQTIDGDQR